MEQPKTHPRIELFLTEGIRYLSSCGKRSRDEYYDILAILWNQFLDDTIKEKIFSYKQDTRVQAVYQKIFEQYYFSYLAKYPQEIVKVCYAVWGRVDKKLLPVFKKYYNRVLEWFLWELSELNISPSHKNTILDYLKVFQNTPQDKQILLDILFDCWDYDKMQPFVRAYQSLINHSYYEFEGKVFSRFSFEIFSRYQEVMGKEMKDREGCFENIAAGYECIFEYLDWEKQSIVDTRDSLAARYKELWMSFSQEEIENHVPFPHYDNEYISIIRHSYDWYVRLVPQEIEKFTPRKLWALWLTFLHKIYNAAWRKYLPKNFQEISLYQRDAFLKNAGEKLTYRQEITSDFAFDDLLLDFMYIDPQLFFSKLSESQGEWLVKDWDKIRKTREEIVYNH